MQEKEKKKGERRFYHDQVSFGGILIFIESAVEVKGVKLPLLVSLDFFDVVTHGYRFMYLLKYFY